MNDQDKAREQLIAELVELRQRVADQDAQLARSQQAEADQRQINNSLPVLVAAAGLDGYYKELNAAFERILGWSEQESLSRPFLEFIHPEDRAAAVETLARLKSGDPAINFLDRNICKDGSHRWINWTVIPVPDRDIVFGIGQDITEQKQAETALRESEERFRRIFDEGPLGFAMFGPDLRIQHVNKRVCDMLGYSEHELLELGVAGVTYPDDLEKDRQLVLSILRGEIPYYTIDKRYVRKDGQVFWGQLTASMIPDADGRPTHGIGMLGDITERKRAEEAIRQSEQRMRLHVKQTPLTVIEWDLELRVTIWNPGAVRVFGYTEEEALGRHFAFLVPSVAKEQVDRVWDALRVKKGGERSTNENITKDGRTILCEWYNTPLVNAEGHVVGFASLGQDITEQKRVEAALRASEAKYRRLHQSMVDAFVSVDMSGHIQEFNDAYCQMLGYGTEELLALRYTNLTPEKWHPFEAQMVQEQILPRGYSDAYEKEYRRKDGTVFPVELRTFLIRDDEGKPTAMWAIIRDITERKQAEKSLQDANRLLEQRVLERTAELAQANALLKVEVEQRRQAEEAIRRSEAKYRALVESSPDAVAMLDLQGRIVFASQRAAEQLGLLHPDELVGLRATEFVVESDRSRLAASLRSLIEEGVHGSVEYRLLRRDGSTFDVEVSSAVIRDVTGTPEALMGVYRDISDRKKAEKAIAESEEKYRHLVEMTDTGFLILDERGCVVDANDEYVRISGHHALPEILGRSVEEWTAPHDAERNAQEVHRCLEQGRVRELDVDYVHADGTVIPIEINANIVETRQGRRILSLCRDITERKRAEEELGQSYEALRQSQATLDAFFSASTAVLNIVDDEFRYLKTDRLTPTYFGLDSQSIVGKSVKDLAPQWVEKYGAMIQRVVETGEPVHNVEISSPLATRPGKIAYWRASYFPLSLPDGRRGYGVVGIEITDLKQAEERLKREQHALQRMLLAGDHERHLITYELHDGVAQQLLGAKMLFESQQPSKGRKSKAADAYQEGMEALHRASSEIRRVMNWLRTPVLDRFGLVEAIADVAAQLRLTPDAPEIEYHHAVQFERLDRTLENTLFRIAQEAMTNACRHSQSKKVRVTLTQTGEDVTLKVQDWGIGFDPNTIQENRFGLEGIRERCRVLGGKLSIKSQPGKGTVVQVKVPVLEATDEE